MVSPFAYNENTSEGCTSATRPHCAAAGDAVTRMTSAMMQFRSVTNILMPLVTWACGCAPPRDGSGILGRFVEALRQQHEPLEAFPRGRTDADEVHPGRGLAAVGVARIPREFGPARRAFAVG